MPCKRRRRMGNGSPMANYSKNVLRRCILVENVNISEIDSKLRQITEEVNKAIQSISLRSEGRLVPFVSLFLGKGSDSLIEKNDVRVLLKGLENEYSKYIELKKCREILSHLLEFQISTEYKQITFSNILCDAKLVLDERYLLCAARDLFLDTAMFNSYSFLRDMSLEEKRHFSLEKYHFFKEQKLPCYYTYDEEDELLYYSLAFSSYNEKGELDIDVYLALWAKFLQKYYKGCVHEERPCEEQLTKHIDRNQLDNKAILSELEKWPKGDYLLLMSNRKAKGKNGDKIAALFGQRAGHLKAWKIVPVNEYSSYASLIEQLYLSAFKLVKI